MHIIFDSDYPSLEHSLFATMTTIEECFIFSFEPETLLGELASEPRVVLTTIRQLYTSPDDAEATGILV